MGKILRNNPIKIIYTAMLLPAVIGLALRLSQTSAIDSSPSNEVVPPNTIGGNYRPSVLHDNSEIHSYQLYTGEIASITNSNGQVIHSITNPENHVTRVLEPQTFNELIEDRGVDLSKPVKSILNRGQITPEGQAFFSQYGFTADSCTIEYGEFGSNTLLTVHDEVTGDWEFRISTGSNEMIGQGEGNWENMTMRLPHPGKICVEG